MKIDTVNMTVHDLLELRSSNMLTVNQEYQRGPVWKLPQKKRLIDSVLRGYPISLIYLHYIKREVAGHQREDFEVIDGQQRITALYEFHEGAFSLFDPDLDQSDARFPNFIREQPCPWGRKDWESLSAELKTAFEQTSLPIAYIIPSDPNEARDLFIRLQAGMPLNAQEKRDAWPGNFTDFVLKIGGKPEIPRYPGHEFFRSLMGATSASGRGKFRQLAAQMAMLILKRKMGGAARFCDTNSRAIDDFYYQNLEFDTSSPMARRFVEVLEKLALLLGDRKRKKLIGHEAIHLVLLVDALLDDYTRSWESRLPEAFDRFREGVAQDKLTKDSQRPGEFWLRYTSWTRVNSDRSETIQRRHEFFCQKMFGWLSPQLRDGQRTFGSLEREVIYYRDKKRCQVCDDQVTWEDAEIHHLQAHANAGPTTLENGVLVHARCHPRGEAAVKFAERYRQKKAQQQTAGDAEDPPEVWSQADALEVGAGRPVFDESHHTSGRPQEVIELYRALDELCLSLQPGPITKKTLKWSINYCTGKRAFCSICLYQSSLRVYLPLLLDEIDATPPFARDVSGVGHQGLGDLELVVSDPSQLGTCAQLIRRSFEFIRRAPRPWL